MCGAFGTFAHQAYAACLRGPVSSNVMHPALVSIANITWLSCSQTIGATRVQRTQSSVACLRAASSLQLLGSAVGRT